MTTFNGRSFTSILVLCNRLHYSLSWLSYKIYSDESASKSFAFHMRCWKPISNCLNESFLIRSRSPKFGFCISNCTPWPDVQSISILSHHRISSHVIWLDFAFQHKTDKLKLLRQCEPLFHCRPLPSDQLPIFKVAGTVGNGLIVGNLPSTLKIRETLFIFRLILRKMNVFCFDRAQADWRNSN